MHVEDGQEDQHLRSARRTVTRPPHGATSATDRLGSISSLLLVVRSPYVLLSRQTRRWHDLLAYIRRAHIVLRRVVLLEHTTFASDLRSSIWLRQKSHPGILQMTSS